MPTLVPERVIGSVKENTSILSVLKERDITVTRKGSSFFAVCPFHSNGAEKNPSLSIDTQKNLYHCFSCEASGNVIQLVQQLDGIGFRESIDKLLAIKEPKVSERRSLCSAQEPPLQLSFEERQTILKQVMEDAKAALRNSTKGRQYLESRGLDPLELLKHYDIGYWNGQYNKLNAVDKTRLEAVGLITDNRMLFKDCIIFPLKKNGVIMSIYGRKAGGDGHYMLPVKREGLFIPSSGLDAREPVILTESVIDSLSLFAAGIKNVLPLLGVNGFLPDHLDYLKSNSFPCIYIALNNDEAGNRAAEQLKENLTKEGFCVKMIITTSNTDINEEFIEMGANKLREKVLSQMTENKQQSLFTVWEGEEEGLYFTGSEREYRTLGLSTFGMDKLRVNIKVYKQNNKHTFHIDTVDLYQSKSREIFIGQAAELLKTDRSLLMNEVNQLITLLEEQRQQRKKEGEKVAVPEMTEEEKKEALDYLKAPNLLERIQKDFADCGMVGNEKNSLMAYFGSLCRLTDKPFGVLIVSRSGAGKSYLQDMVSSFVPEENLMQLTRLTGQSLFYLSKQGLKHKFLTIEEDEGMQEAMYSIRTLLSSQRLRLHGLKTDTKSGEFTTMEKVVEGPAAVMITTTDMSRFDHETLNRFFVLYLDETPEQTRKILEHQEIMAGIKGLECDIKRQKIEKLHRNIQRLLKPLHVSNEIGVGLQYPAAILNVRRERKKVEALIKTVALLHQYQREIKERRFLGAVTQYIEVAQSDVDFVQELAGDFLSQSLDELNPLCRELLLHVHKLVDERHDILRKAYPEVERWRVTFTRKELRDTCRWSRWHLEQQLNELIEQGYITPRFGKQGQKYAYCLVVDEIPEPLVFKQNHKNHKNL
jgi:DNA primase catalytic core